MAKSILPDSSKRLNNQQAILDSLIHCLHKAQALSEVAATSDFCSRPQPIVQDYCWVISDLLDEAVQLSGQLH